MSKRVADLLLGADFAWRQFYPDKATIIQIDSDPTDIGRRHPVAIGAVSDIKPTLEALVAHQHAGRRTAGDARHIWARRRAGEMRDLAKTNFWQ